MAGRGARGFGRSRASVHLQKLANDTGNDVKQITTLHQSLAEKSLALYPEIEPEDAALREPMTEVEKYMVQKHQLLLERFRQSTHHLSPSAPQQEIERYSDAYAQAPSSLSTTLESALAANLFPAELVSGMAAAQRGTAAAVVGQFAAGGFVPGGAVRRARSLSGAFGRLEEKERRGMLMAPPPRKRARQISVDSLDAKNDDDDGEGDYSVNYYKSDEEDGAADDDAEPTY